MTDIGIKFSFFHLFKYILSKVVCDQNLPGVVQFSSNKKSDIHFIMKIIPVAVLHGIWQTINLRQHLLHEDRAIVNHFSELLTTFDTRDL